MTAESVRSGEARSVRSGEARSALQSTEPVPVASLSVSRCQSLLPSPTHVTRGGAVEVPQRPTASSSDMPPAGAGWAPLPPAAAICPERRAAPPGRLHRLCWMGRALPPVPRLGRVMGRVSGPCDRSGDVAASISSRRWLRRSPPPVLCPLSFHPLSSSPTLHLCHLASII